MNAPRSAETEETQKVIRVNSATIVIVTIIGFIISILLYIFFVIIPIQRTEKKAEDAIQKIENTSAQVSKVATDAENILHEVEELGGRIERVFEPVDQLCQTGNVGIGLACNALFSNSPTEASICEQVLENVVCPILTNNTASNLTSNLSNINFQKLASLSDSSRSSYNSNSNTYQ